MKSDNVRKVHFVNNACEEGMLDTERLKLLSIDAGLSRTNDLRQADLVLFFACGHLTRDETDALRIIERIQRDKKPSAQLIVWGCLPNINPKSLRRIYGGPLVGPEDWDFFSELFSRPKQRIDKIFANTLSVRERTPPPKDLSVQGRIVEFTFRKLTTHIGKTWYIKIVSGCRNCCTYCSDRLAYKLARSVPIDTILEQFKLGLEANFRHFLFVGRDLGSYGYDIGLDLADLLNKIVETYPDDPFKISLCNVSPDFLIPLYPKLDQKVLSTRIFEIGSHIQTGSERILKLMGKKFKLDNWKRIIEDLDRNYPQVRIATSVMTGFPGETEEDFRGTLNLLSELLFDRIAVYTYNERPNLPSLKLKDRVPETTKIRRRKEIQALARLNIVRKKIKRARFFY